MTQQALIGAQIFWDGAWQLDYAVVIDGGLISAVLPAHELSKTVHRIDLHGGSLLPGFIDCQVNGGGGILLNDALTVEGVRTIARAHRQYGTTGLLPTLISDDLDVVAAAITAVDGAIDAGVPGILGIHIEGPFLNEKKRGIHDATKFRKLNAQAIELLSSLKNGKTVVTLAPELTDSATISALTARGVIVVAGHTLATYENMQIAFAAGLTGVTHLFNAMTQFESRSPGVVGAALENKNCFCGIIVDGHHVHPAALRLAFAARGADGLMLVTDAMPTVGAKSKQFILGGQKITAHDGACMSVDGTLAGSDLDMAMAVRNALKFMTVDLASASIMASKTPATFLEMNKIRGTIGVGMMADLVHLDETLHVRSTWIAGQHEGHKT
jgi:N-acetylglucosamine-6-phosphate deacetylase